MYVLNEYKEGVIYSKLNSDIYFRAKFKSNSQDEIIYETLKKIADLLKNRNINIKIQYCKDKIIDQEPADIRDIDILIEDIETLY